MARYLVDVVFLPDRDSGVRVDVQAGSQDEAIDLATLRLARQIPSIWALEVDNVRVA